MGWCGLGQLAQLPPYSLGMDPNGALDGAPTMHLADVTLPLLSYGLMVAPDYDGCSGGSSEGGSTPLRTTESSASGEGAEGADDAPPLGVGGVEVPPLLPPGRPGRPEETFQLCRKFLRAELLAAECRPGPGARFPKSTFVFRSLGKTNVDFSLSLKLYM